MIVTTHEEGEGDEISLRLSTRWEPNGVGNGGYFLLRWILYICWLCLKNNNNNNTYIILIIFIYEEKDNSIIFRKLDKNLIQV